MQPSLWIIHIIPLDFYPLHKLQQTQKSKTQTHNTHHVLIYLKTRIYLKTGFQQNGNQKLHRILKNVRVIQYNYEQYTTTHSISRFPLQVPI